MVNPHKKIAEEETASFHVVIDEDAQKYLDDLPSKSNRIVKDKLKLLEKEPFPEKNKDKELIHFSDYDAYRMHIARSYTVFYQISKEDKIVKILWLGTIDQAHKLYGR